MGKCERYPARGALCVSMGAHLVALMRAGCQTLQRIAGFRWLLSRLWVTAGALLAGLRGAD